MRTMSSEPGPLVTDRGDDMETINRDDRRNYFFSDRSYHMETGLRKWSVNEQNVSLICNWEKSYSFQSDPTFLKLPPANLLHKH